MFPTKMSRVQIPPPRLSIYQKKQICVRDVLYPSNNLLHKFQTKNIHFLVKQGVDFHRYSYYCYNFFFFLFGGKVNAEGIRKKPNERRWNTYSLTMATRKASIASFSISRSLMSYTTSFLTPKQTQNQTKPRNINTQQLQFQN